MAQVYQHSVVGTGLYSAVSELDITLSDSISNNAWDDGRG